MLALAATSRSPFFLHDTISNTFGLIQPQRNANTRMNFILPPHFRIYRINTLPPEARPQVAKLFPEFFPNE